MVRPRSKRKADDEVGAVEEAQRVKICTVKSSAVKRVPKSATRGGSGGSACKNSRRMRSEGDFASSRPTRRRREERPEIPKLQSKRRCKYPGDSDGGDMPISSTDERSTAHSSPSAASSAATTSEESHRSADISTSSDGFVSCADDADIASEDVADRVQELLSSSEDDYGDHQQLPKRLFATDRYPTHGRINSYSKMQYLADILVILDGLPEQYQSLMNSCFGSLFKLPVRRCLLSGKLVHSFLCRQILSKNSHELWFTFGGHPIRFSLREFELVTGLPCGPFPDNGDIFAVETSDEQRSPFWEELIGSQADVTIKDIFEMLQAEPTMDPLRKMRLVLIVIVDGILICGTQPICPSVQVVEMVRHLDTFFAYPWGRVAFERTLRMVKVGDKISRLSELTTKLLQKSVVVHGFPISIQLFLFRSIPLLLRHLPFSDDDHTFLDKRLTILPILKTYHTENIIQLENDPQLRVQFILPLITDELRECVPVLFESDPKIHKLLSLIEGGFRFSKVHWRGGYALLPLLYICKKRKNLRCKCGARLDVQSRTAALDAKNAATVDKDDHIAKLTQEVHLLKRRNEVQLKKLKAYLITEMRVLLRSHFPVPTVYSIPPDFGVDRVTTMPPDTHPARAGSVANGVVLPTSDSMSRHSPDQMCGFSGRCVQTVAATPVPSIPTEPRTVTATVVEGAPDKVVHACQELLGRQTFVPARVGTVIDHNYVADVPQVPGNVSASAQCDIFEPSSPSKVTGEHVLVNYVLIDPSPIPINYAPPVIPPKNSDGEIISPVRLPFAPFPVLKDSLVKKFKAKLSAYRQKFYDLDGCEVGKAFFSEIYKPQQWVSRTHIDFMIRVLWKRHRSVLSAKGVVIFDSLLTHLIASQYLTFIQSPDPTEYAWHRVLSTFVDGTYGDRTQPTMWFKDVSTIYVPMNWGNKHWVALVISLKSWHIYILDPLVLGTSDRKVSSYMAPLVKLLPHFIKSTCERVDIGHDADSDFSYSRLQGLAQNDRTGDCGPFSIKFIELHSHGWSVEQLSNIDDAMVDVFRMQYAVNVYEQFVGKLT